MTFTRFLRVLLARKRTLLLVAVSIFALAVAVTLLMPKKFTAIATVLSDPKAPDPVYGYTLPSYAAAETNIATQVDILTSERVGIRVVRMLGLDKDPAARAEWLDDGEGKGTIEQYFAGDLIDHLDVKPSRESDVISIQYTSSSPNYAAAVVNAFAKAYVDTSLEMRTDPARASSEFFDKRTRELRLDVERAQARLSDFQRSHGITVTDERLDVENGRLNELSTQLTAIQAVRMESQSRQNQALGSTSRSPDVLQNPVIQQLRTDIGHSEAKLQELKKQLGSKHPQLAAAQAELDSLRGRLESEMRQVADSVGSSNTVNLQREAEIKAALEEQKRRVLQMRAERDQAGVLEKDLEAAQKAYDLVAQRRSQTNLESLNQQSNVMVLSESLPPTEPSRPRVRLNLLLGTFLGVLFGVGAALFQEFRDQRVRGFDDALQMFGLPILATLPPGIRPGSMAQDRVSFGTRVRRIGFKRRALDTAS